MPSSPLSSGPSVSPGGGESEKRGLLWIYPRLSSTMYSHHVIPAVNLFKQGRGPIHRGSFSFLFLSLKEKEAKKQPSIIALKQELENGVKENLLG